MPEVTGVRCCILRIVLACASVSFGGQTGGAWGSDLLSRGAGANLHRQQRHSLSDICKHLINEVKADAKSKVITTLELVSEPEHGRQDGKMA